MKILLNQCFGGFTLSKRAKDLYEQRTGKQWPINDRRSSARTDPEMVRIVEELGRAAGGSCSEIGVVEIPDGFLFDIDDYDGSESVEIFLPRNWRELPLDALREKVAVMEKFNGWHRGSSSDSDHDEIEEEN